jgi:hypothetical protein
VHFARLLEQLESLRMELRILVRLRKQILGIDGVND